MPRARGVTFERWFECSLCGFDYPASLLVRQNGQLRCTVIPCMNAMGRSDYLAEHDVDAEEIRDAPDGDEFVIPG